MNFFRASQENETEETKEAHTEPPASVAAAWTSDRGQDGHGRSMFGQILHSIDKRWGGIRVTNSIGFNRSEFPGDCCGYPG